MSIARTRPGVTVLLVLAVIAIASLVAAGCASSSDPLSAEDVAQGIDKGLMCPVCPSETIDQSQVEIANQMQIIVREKLAAGESRDDIFQFFVDRYGPGILAEPPKSGFNLLVWVIPPMALLLGSGALTMIVRSMRRERPEYAEVDTDAPLSAAELEPYLSAVDQEIRRLTQGSGSGAEEQQNTIPDNPDNKAFGGKVE
ncbi:MAG: cytochrome c-type biogenesis protein CcmH [Chloroflexi bacterium]|nr:cytochrome c-type biogenesis protein CcmH [Chloroflexota bacterium]